LLLPQHTMPPSRGKLLCALWLWLVDSPSKVRYTFLQLTFPINLLSQLFDLSDSRIGTSKTCYAGRSNQMSHCFCRLAQGRWLSRRASPVPVSAGCPHYRVSGIAP